MFDLPSPMAMSADSRAWSRARMPVTGPLGLVGRDGREETELTGRLLRRQPCCGLVTISPGRARRAVYDVVRRVTGVAWVRSSKQWTHTGSGRGPIARRPINPSDQYEASKASPAFSLSHRPRRSRPHRL